MYGIALVKQILFEIIVLIVGM
uniref:Uncharacterized protein n=1 Tax=Rhizophora mucronata TaxID=61149 RepID=A0A2P2NS22_RHIMU